jgi:hypothetical protein
VEGDLDLEAAGLDSEEVELLDSGTDRPAADLFNDSHAMVGVNNFVADLKAQLTIHESTRQGLRGSASVMKHYKTITGLSANYLQ